MDQNRLPKISVIMPCHNAASYLEEAVGSVLRQTFQALELIAIDDGSVDASPKILEKLQSQDGRIRVLRQENKGPYPARNLGLKHARGQFIAFLDADDWWDKTFLEEMHRALEASGADLAYCGWQNVAEEGQSRPPYLPPDYLQEDLAVRLLKGCPWPIHAALVRRGVIEAVEGFSTHCFTSMDYDLWLKIAALSRNWMRVPKVLAYYRWHNTGQISAIRWRQVMEESRVRHEFAKQHPEYFQHLNRRDFKRLLREPVLQAAYQALWRRDLDSAHRLFRHAFRCGGWRAKDLKYLLASLLPFSWYRWVVGA